MSSQDFHRIIRTRLKFLLGGNKLEENLKCVRFVNDTSLGAIRQKDTNALTQTLARRLLRGGVLKKHPLTKRSVTNKNWIIIQGKKGKVYQLADAF